MQDVLKAHPIAFVATIVVLLASAVIGVVGHSGSTDSTSTAACTDPGRFGLSLPDDSPWSSGAFVANCDFRQPNSKPRVDVYDAKSGGQVVAWWYVNCGMPDGVVRVGSDYPAQCGTGVTFAEDSNP